MVGEEDREKITTQAKWFENRAYSRSSINSC